MQERFHYTGFDAAGSGVNGTVDAASLPQARADLRERDILVSEIRPEGETADWREQLGLGQSRVGLAQLEIITSELALLLENGVRIDRGLEIMYRGSSEPATRRLLDGLLQSIKQGNQLSVAAADWPQVFDPLYVNLLSLGEASGRLAAVFRRLADDLGFRRDLRQQSYYRGDLPAGHPVGMYRLAVVHFQFRRAQPGQPCSRIIRTCPGTRKR